MLARRSRAILAAILVVAVILRLALLAADPRPYDSAGLALSHGEMARVTLDHGRWFHVNLRAQEAIGRLQRAESRLVDPQSVQLDDEDARAEWQPVILQPVGQGVVLAGLWTLTGDQSYIYVQLLQVLLDALMVLLVFSIALRLYRRERAALIAAGLYAVFLPVAVLTRIPHLDIWGVHFTIAITAVMVHALDGERARPGLLTLAGVLTGIGAYFRPGVLLLPLALALVWMIWTGWRRAAVAALVPLMVASALLVPWVARNYAEFDRFIPTRIGIGQNLWEGLGEVDNDFGAILSDDLTAKQVARERPDLQYGTPEYDDLLRQWATDAMREHPAHVAKVVARRAAVTTVAMNNLGYPFGVMETLLFLLAVGAAVVTRRPFARQHLLLASVVVATILPYLVLHVEPRYVVPASFVYLIWVALAADLLIAGRRVSEPS